MDEALKGDRQVCLESLRAIYPSGPSSVQLGLRSLAQPLAPGFEIYILGFLVTVPATDISKAGT